MKTGRFILSGRRLRATAADLEGLWSSLPPGGADRE
jgi:hypothetical protein